MSRILEKKIGPKEEVTVETEPNNSGLSIMTKARVKSYYYRQEIKNHYNIIYNI